MRVFLLDLRWLVLGAQVRTAGFLDGYVQLISSGLEPRGSPELFGLLYPRFLASILSTRTRSKAPVRPT